VSTTLSVVMMGATGAVGTQVLTALLAQATSLRLTSLVRRMDAALNDTR
jgi:thioester reductase-like protein